jgi:hypothetical protein
MSLADALQRRHGGTIGLILARSEGPHSGRGNGRTAVHRRRTATRTGQLAGGVLGGSCGIKGRVIGHPGGRRNVMTRDFGRCIILSRSNRPEGSPLLIGELEIFFGTTRPDVDFTGSPTKN